MIKGWKIVNHCEYRKRRLETNQVKVIMRIEARANSKDKTFIFIPINQRKTIIHGQRGEFQLF